MKEATSKYWRKLEESKDYGEKSNVQALYLLPQTREGGGKKSTSGFELDERKRGKAAEPYNL